MEAGEKEMRKVFEETTTRNVQVCIDYSTNTREIVRELERRTLLAEEKLLQQDVQFAALRQQLAYLQSKMYQGGSI